VSLDSLFGTKCYVVLILRMRCLFLPFKKKKYKVLLLLVYIYYNFQSYLSYFLVHTSMPMRTKKYIYSSQLDYVNFKFISFITHNNTNKLYYNKNYRTIEIGELFCVTKYSKERI
jgi:hypothetical protein